MTKRWVAVGFTLLLGTGLSQAPPASSNPAENPGLSTPLIRTIDPRTGEVSSRFARRILASGRIDTTWVPDSSLRFVGSIDGPPGPVIADGAGGSYVAWSGLGSIYGDVYLQRIDASGQIAEGWPTGGVPVCRADNSQYNIALAPDGASGAFVAWQDFRSGLQSEIYLQRVTSTGAVAQGWPENGRRIAEIIGDQYSPAIAADANGGVTLAWQDRRSGEPRIQALALNQEGEVRGAWPPTGACLDSQHGVGDAAAVTAIQNQVLVTWRSRDSLGVCRILVRRFNSASAPDTTANPIILAEGTGQWLSEPAVVADSSGYLVTWTRRSETIGSIEMQRVAANEAPRWPTPATVTSVGAGFLPPNLIRDGSGGAFVVWDDFRTPAATGVFLQHIGAAGDSAACWTTNGLNLTPGSSRPYGALAMPDGAGGLIVSWAASDTTSLKQLLGAGEIQPLRGLRVREARATPGRARITWQSYEPLAGDLLIERRLLPSNWEKLAAATAADSGFIRCDDQAAPEGSDLEYRVVLRRPNGAVMFAPVRLSIPVAPSILSLHWVRYDAPSGAVELSFSLPRGPQPSVEFLDVAGRRMHRQSLSNLDPGEQRVQLRLPSRMASGMYFMRLSQGSQIRTLKLAVVR